ncbi:hypothetical protein NLM31_22825 [Bradyrhizobium sp. CCGUVB4N]|uniref:hypothetical protein n=1 Tax=Bradyrhizobium sp. CCGUVB4N TaxID=2949631 RepID=UPI0020B406F4|nr:hypothetical protein [Bradyrhizobium sp. CCGUVB4N]MCP3383205.1 hypothetical protein [Bradyrhizobium sp. CCGUVB4N]
MGLFGSRQQWNEVYLINTRRVVGRNFLAVLFWLWGIAGFFVVIVDALDTMSKLQSGVGVGQSSFLAAIAVVWIGGMVFFGLGALLAGSDMEVVQRAEDYGDVRVGR